MKNWGEIEVFLCSSKGQVCFWANSKCWPAGCVVWVKGARKNNEKCGQKITENCRNLQKCSKSFIYCHKFARNSPNLYFNILLREGIWGILVCHRAHRKHRDFKLAWCSPY